MAQHSYSKLDKLVWIIQEQNETVEKLGKPELVVQLELWNSVIENKIRGLTKL